MTIFHEGKWGSIILISQEFLSQNYGPGSFWVNEIRSSVRSCFFVRPMEDRKLKERAFHNLCEQDRYQLGSESFGKRCANFKFYSIVRKRQEYVSDLMERSCSEKVVLDYCCGDGEMSLELANHGAFVYGVDLSDESVSTAKETLAKAGYQDCSQFAVMDAENLVLLTVSSMLLYVAVCYIILSLNTLFENCTAY